MLAKRDSALDELTSDLVRLFLNSHDRRIPAEHLVLDTEFGAFGLIRALFYLAKGGYLE